MATDSTDPDRPRFNDLLENARHFAREEVAPDAARWELERILPRDTLARAAERGLTGLLVPRELGGAGLVPKDMVRIVEVLAAADLALTFDLVVHNNLMNAIASYASPELKSRYLPPLHRLDLLGAFLLTEPGAGSDAAAISTRARRRAGGWVIDGAKAWVTNGSHADLLSVYAQTDPELGARGIAGFLVESTTAGVVREEPYRLLGGHALGTCNIRFDSVQVDDERMFLAPGSGFRAAMAGIDLARVLVGAMCCGMLDACLQLTVDRLRQRHAFGRPLAEQQGLVWQLADVATDLEAARLLVRQAAVDLETGAADASVNAAHAKKFATRAALRGTTQCMQAHGAEGLRHEHPFARHLAGAKIAEYIDGTTEIQNVVISRALFA